MSLDDCELAILRSAVDTAEEQQGEKIANSPEVKKMIAIVENFIRKKRLVCYGGTAINNLLPKRDQFYNRDLEVPDYDFYSPDALDDTKELADEYVRAGFVEVEAKSGVHHGTFKVYVNFMPMADITFMPKELFRSVLKESVVVAGIHYAPPNLLRMSMYLELSRPAGDVSRWEKVLKRLMLLNKHYPLVGKQCNQVDFQRKMGASTQSDRDRDSDHDEEWTDRLYKTVQKTLADQGSVLFGGNAVSMYSRYMPKSLQRKLEKIPDFDVLSEEPLQTAQIVKERLRDEGFDQVKIIKRPGVGEIISPHYEIRVGQDTIVFIYEPLACHSYNEIDDPESGDELRVATIDTMLSFYLAFLFANRPYYDKTRILCMAQYLFDVQSKNRLAQKGLLRRFSLNCVGHQPTLGEIRAEKAEKFLELKDKQATDEYNSWFLRYRPTDNTAETNTANTKTKTKTKTKATKTTKSKTKSKPRSRSRSRSRIRSNRRRPRTLRHRQSRKKGIWWGVS